MGNLLIIIFYWFFINDTHLSYINGFDNGGVPKKPFNVFLKELDLTQSVNKLTSPTKPDSNKKPRIKDTNKLPSKLRSL
jgi:hypothetical protein